MIVKLVTSIKAIIAFLRHLKIGKILGMLIQSGKLRKVSRVLFY